MMSTESIESLERTYRPSWLSQFGLYKYDGAEPYYHEYGGKQKPKCQITVALLCGLLVSLFLVAYLMIAALSRTERIDMLPEPAIEVENTETEVDFETPAIVKSIPKEEINGRIEVDKSHILTINHTFSTEPSVKVQPQKLVFLPSRYLKPPKRDTISNRRTRPPIKRQQLPRPFNHYMPSPYPNPFKRMSTTHGLLTSDSEEDALNQYPGIVKSGMQPVIGLYRRPKAVFTNELQADPSSTHPTNAIFLPDPFRNYKPKTPDDVNLLVLDQPNRKKQSSQYDEQYLKNAHALYQQITAASRQKLKTLRNSGHQLNRPFQLMLDVYPVAEDTYASSKTQKKNILKNISNDIRYNSYAAKLNAFNSIDQEKVYDGSYFKRMRFAQIQPKNPYAPYYENPYSTGNIKASGNYINDDLDPEESQVTDRGRKKQLVVHLNLYPKKGSIAEKMKHIDPNYDEYEEDDYDDSSEYFRRSSKDTDDVYRVLKKRNRIKNHRTKNLLKENNNSTPIAINFNFPTTPTPVSDFDCGEQKRKSSSIDRNHNTDTNSDRFYSTPTMSPIKFKDFPYRFVSTPPANWKPKLARTKQVRPTHKFRHRILNASLNNSFIITTEPTLLDSMSLYVTAASIANNTIYP